MRPSAKNGSVQKEVPGAFDWFWNLVGGGTKPDEMCSFCSVEGERIITKEKPEVYEEAVVTRQEFNRETRKFEKVTKKVMRLKEFPDEPHPTEIVENMQYQYMFDGFVKERQMPFCTNVIEGVERPHYAHYSCIRDLVIREDAIANDAVCPECRSKVQKDVIVLIRNTPGYPKKLQKIKEKNEKFKKFNETIYRRELSYYYQNGSMLAEDEMRKMIYTKEDARKKMQPMEKHLYSLAIQTYTDRFFEIAENENGLNEYKDMKKNFFKHIPSSYTDEMFDVEHADMASIVIMGSVEFADPGLKEYLDGKKELGSMPAEVMRGVVQYFLMTYLAAHIWTVLQEGFEATKDYVNMGMDHAKAIVWVFMLDPRPILFGDFKIAELLYNYVIGADASSLYKNSVPIPLTGLSEDHINWLYLMGFSFTRFVVSKEHGKKIGDYKVSIPSLLFWKQRDYDTSIKTISNVIMNGAGSSGIDKATANAIATISYNNREKGGSVRFEVGPYGGMDMTPKQWTIRLAEEDAIIQRQRRRQQENERQLIQEIEGLNISELLFGQSSSNLSNPQELFHILETAVYALDIGKYNRYKKYALENGVLLHVSIQQPNRNPWLKAIKTAGSTYKIFYYVVFIDLLMNVMITGGSKNVTTAEKNYCANALTNKVLGHFAADCDLQDFKELTDMIKFENYLSFAEHLGDNMVINNVKHVKEVYEKVEYYGDAISYLPVQDMERYQRSLNTITTRENDIGSVVPLVALYINDMIMKSYVEEDDDAVRAFLKLIQLILEYCFSGKGIRKIKPFITKNDELLKDLMPQLNIEVFADLIIKHNELDRLQRLAMSYDIRQAVKK